MLLKEQAVSGVKWNGINAGIVATLQFVTLAILARLLVPTDFGLMGMVLVVIGFARLFADIGVSNAIIYRQDATRESLSSLYWLNILGGIAIFFIVCALTPLVVILYHEPRLSSLMYLLALTFLITPFGQQFQMLLQKELQFKQLARITIIAAAANSAVAIILAIGGMGVFSLIWGQLVGAFVRVLQLSFWGWRRWKPQWHFSRNSLKGYIGFGLYQLGERTVNYFNSNLDYLLIGILLGAKPLGYYTLAYNLILRPSLKINPIITRVAFPVFSKLQNDVVKLKKGYLKVLQVLSLVNFPLMVGLAIVAPVAVPVIFGERWVPSVILVQILTVVGLLRSVNNPVGSLLLSKGRADLGFKWNVGVMITQIPGLYLGAKYGGTVGVAVAFAILQILYTMLNYLILIRPLLGPCLREYISSMWPSLLMSVAMGGAVFCTSVFLQKLPQELLLTTQVLCGVTVFLGLMVYTQRKVVVEIKEMLWSKG
ncbi:MAG: MOP flippase family protein [Candidatus Omnitrophota bacterium]